MKIELHIGERGTVEDFSNAYKKAFLINYGFAVLNDFGSKKILYLVYTKNGAEKVHGADTVTYVGNQQWSIERFNNEAEDNEIY